MSPRLLLGNNRPLPDALGITWVAVAGWAMGTTALSYLLPPSRFSGMHVLFLFCGLAPALLSGAAAWFGSRGRGVTITAVRTLFGSMVTALFCALFCPPLVWLVLLGGALIASGGTSMAYSQVSSLPEQVAMMTIFGAIFAVPLGLAFGTVYAIALSLFTALQRRVPSRSDLDLALVTGGIGLVFIGNACLAVSAPYLSHAPARTLAPMLTAGLGLLGTLIGTGRYAIRRVFIWRARRGAIADWAVVPASDIADAESLPRLFAFGSAETILVRRETTHAGPFRSGEASTPIARC